MDRIGAYLDRIGYTGERTPNAENLSALQYAHLTSVPYENLDILLGRRIVLDVDAVYKKVVEEHRGGYCFELNLLFAWLLRELGYTVTDYVARYLRGETTLPKRRHQVLSVVIPGTGEEYLCDVGVGSVIPLWPVPLEIGRECVQGDVTYSFREDERLGIVLTERHGGGWRDVYSFTRDAQYETDYIFASFWCEFAPDSPFNKKYILSIRKPGNIRITIDDFELKTFEGEKVTAVALTPEERETALRDIFGVTL